MFSSILIWFYLFFSKQTSRWAQTVVKCSYAFYTEWWCFCLLVLLCGKVAGECVGVLQSHSLAALLQANWMAFREWFLLANQKHLLCWKRYHRLCPKWHRERALCSWCISWLHLKNPHGGRTQVPCFPREGNAVPLTWKQVGFCLHMYTLWSINSWFFGVCYSGQVLWWF